MWTESSLYVDGYWTSTDTWLGNVEDMNNWAFHERVYAVPFMNKWRNKII